MLNRAWMEIDLGALVRNAKALRDHAGVPIIPMIKADAYGLGAERVAHALEPLAPVAYGVATVEEGRELRIAGISRPVIIFTPILEADMAAAHAASLTPTLGSPESIRAWSKIGGAYELSIDTGMSRAGLPWRELPGILDVLREHPPSGAFTHFHSPALPGESMEAQERRFGDAIGMLPSRPGILHTDSSAAIVRHGKSAWDAVRPGIFMYGVGSGEGAELEPEPVVSVMAPIVEIRDVEAGDTVSYEATWTAPSRRQIATVSMGYADGYPRNASGHGVGVIRERVIPIAGRVTMDMIMLDTSGIEAAVGDIVTLIGDGSRLGAQIDVASVASAAGMSPYELLTGLRGRMRRIYKG